MSRSLYLVGGAGTGKSTFMAQLLLELGAVMGPLVDLHAKRNAKALVTLRGHWLDTDSGKIGLYLGHLRPGNHPGTDGLDRASGRTGVEWLQQTARLPFIVGEGATLATRPFLSELNSSTELMLLHLTCSSEAELSRRFARRGTEQNASFVTSTRTAARNRAVELEKAGANVVHVETTRVGACDEGLDQAVEWLESAN